MKLIAETLNVGALTVRIGFCGTLYFTVIIRNPQNKNENYLSPYIELFGFSTPRE